MISKSLYELNYSLISSNPIHIERVTPNEKFISKSLLSFHLKKLSIEERILRIVTNKGEDGILQTQLVSALGYSRSYISETLKKMENKGILRRERENPFQLRIYLLKNNKKYSRRISVGLLASSEYIFAIAAIRRVARKAGISVNFKFYANTRNLNSDAMAGKIQILLSPTLSQLIMSLSSDSISMLRPIATGGSCIIENVKSKSDLNISSSSSTMILMMSKFLDGKGKNDVRRMDDAAKSIELIRNGSYKRIAIWEPYASNLLLDENCNVSAFYREILGNFPCCFLCTTHEFEKSMPEMVSLICSEYDAEIEELNFKEKDVLCAIELISNKTGIPFPVVVKTLQNYDFKIKYSREELLAFVEELKIYLTTEQIESLFGKT